MTFHLKWTKNPSSPKKREKGSTVNDSLVYKLKKGTFSFILGCWPSVSSSLLLMESIQSLLKISSLLVLMWQFMMMLLSLKMTFKATSWLPKIKSERKEVKLYFPDWKEWIQLERTNGLTKIPQKILRSSIKISSKILPSWSQVKRSLRL